jgi:hypothetical protein
MRSLAAAAFLQSSSNGAAVLEQQANVVKSGMSKPLFSPVLSEAAFLTLRTGEKPPENGGKQALNGEILD